MHCLSWINAWACESITRPALVFADNERQLFSFSWFELRESVAAAVQSIKRQGFTVGDRLVHAEGNTDRGIVLALASLVLGTIEVPLDPALNITEREELRGMVDGRWFDGDAAKRSVSSADAEWGLSHLESVERGFAPDQPALILFTSGSTGRPRAVTLSRKNLFFNAHAKLKAVPQERSDVRLTVLPLWHAYARTCDLMTWLISGCTLAIGHGWTGWQILAPQVKPTLLNAVPSFASRLMSTDIDAESASRLQLLGCGGAAMAAEVFEAFQRRGTIVIQGYGLTEASPVICSATPENSRVGHVGQPVTGCSIRISEAGTLEVSGDGVMLGYWNDIESTKATICEGWLKTGDCVEIDPSDGQLRILGRNDDRITLPNGRKFFPGPIEQRATSVLGVRHALVVPNDRHFVLIIDHDSESASADRMRLMLDEAMQELPQWQRPRKIEIFAPTFASIAGAVTQKGTLCRPVATQAVISQVAKMKN